MRASPLMLVPVFLLAALSLSPAQEAVEQPAAVNPNPLSSLDLESLSATRSFPLFTPSRTAPVIAEAPVESEPVLVEQPVVDPEQPPPPLQLVGIVLTEETKTALLLDSNNNEVHRLTSGDEFEGWSLTIVDARSVEFRSGDRVEGLKMFESFAAPSPGMMPAFPDESMPPDMMSEPGMVPPEGMPQSEMPPMEGTPPPGDPMKPDPATRPPPEGLPPDFDPALGNGPPPEEGPLPLEGNQNSG